jgi:hypothetical protein
MVLLIEIILFSIQYTVDRVPLEGYVLFCCFRHAYVSVLATFVTLIHSVGL